MIVERKSTRAEMEADCATFDNLMANLSEDDYVSEDAAFGIGGERDDDYARFHHNDPFRMKRLRRKCPKSAISNM